MVFFSLYKQTKTTNAQLVAEGVASVRFDQYVPGGPLYYLCPSAEQLSWTDLIEDDKRGGGRSFTGAKAH